MLVCPNCREENPDRFRLCGFCGTPLGAATAQAEERKVVTVFFSDLKGSTNLGEKLDPESLREVMTRYFDAMTEVLVRHGGTIEKFIGDAIMAVFGLPKLHEDDALRAVRAAHQTRNRLAALNDELRLSYGVELTNRTGVNTGEVVAGDPTTGQRLVTGDVVNVAARLEQAAPPNEVLIGELTHRLVRDAVKVEEVEPLELKGKSERVRAYRLLDVSGAVAGYQRRQDAPLVGREAELEQLTDIYRRAIAEGGCRMATVIADAGVGKSRLISEFTRPMHEGATVLHGRCLPYGDGITFWPLVEAVREAAAIEPEDSPSQALARIESLTGDAEITMRIGAAIGLSGDAYPLEEIFWAARRLLEELGRERPVVVVIDDIHWAEANFLSMLEHLLESIDGSGVLLLCTARHDLLEMRPEWATDARSQRIVLGPLGDADAARVVQGLLGEAGIAGRAQERIVQAAEGNPLFVEQMLSMLIDNGTLRLAGERWEAAGDLADLSVPPSIQALLAARLDLLGRDERAVIEPASVIGVSFAQAAVTALASPALETTVPDHLGTMTRKQLIRPTVTINPEGDDYRFAHILIRDAAYGGLLKRARATLHERFADWADEQNQRLGRSQEYEEILGYHLGEAYRYLAELGTLDEHARSIGARAADKLAAAGRRALSRGDMHAAASLLRRAAATLPDGELAQLRLLPDLGEALMELGEFGAAERTIRDAIAGATRLGAATVAAEAELVGVLAKLFSSPEGDWSSGVLAAVDRATPIFEREQDHAGLALAARLSFAVHGTANRFALAADAAERVIEHAREAGNLRLERRGAVGYAQAALYGTTPVPAAIIRLEELVSLVEGDRRTEALVRAALAQLYAMQGQFDRARDAYAGSRRLLDDLGSALLSASHSTVLGQIELLAGDLSAAEEELRRDLAALQAMGETYLQSGVMGLLARVLYSEGKTDEAHQLTERVEEIAAADDIDAQVEWRGIRAATLATRGLAREAAELARGAVAISDAADAPLLKALALSMQAEVSRLAGETEQERAAADAARAIYEAKGDVVSAARLLPRIEA